MLSDYVTADNEPIRPRNIRFKGVPGKGYYASDLTDAWLRYCPPSQESATSATSATSQVTALFPVADTRRVADTNPLTATAQATGPA
jgi:hypothetical protein